MIHLHVRDENEGHTLDAETYRIATKAVREAVGPDMIVQVTSEAVGLYTAEEQMAMVRDVRPEAVSLAVRELCPDAASETAASAFFAWLVAENIHPQFILYDAADVTRMVDLCQRGIVPIDAPSVLYVLGRYSKDLTSAPLDLLPFLDAAGERKWPWSICAFGHLEAACALSAAAMDGHVRVGFENNLLMADGSTAPDNAALVAQVTQNAAVMGRRAATPAEAREIFQIG